VEARLRSEGEVRGRLDELTVRSLLELCCAIRPDSRVGVRDASFLYEVEIRDGAPRRVTRTSADGAFERGERVLGALLGVGAGRFTVAPAATAIPAEDRDLSGSLNAQLARPVAIARAARASITGARTIGVEKVKLEPEALRALFLSTPEPARTIVRLLAEGASPRGMLLAGEVDPSMLEEVLGDLASRGAVRGVWVQGGEEVLAKAVDVLLAAPEPSLRSASPPRGRSSSRPPPPDRQPPPPSDRSSGPASSIEPTPSSLADAVMRELSERAPELRSRSSNPPPIVEPSELRPRSSSPPYPAAERAPSLPPDAVVPGESEDKTEIDAPVAPTRHGFSLEELAESIPIDLSPMPAAAAAVTGAQLGEAEDIDFPEPERPLRTPLSSVASRDPAPLELPARRARWPWIMAIAVVAVAVLVGADATRVPAIPQAAAGAELDRAPLPATPGVPLTTGAEASYDAIPEGIAVSPGQGLLEVSVGTLTSAPVRVDGVARSRSEGPVVRLPLIAGPHQVEVAGVDRAVDVRAGRTAKVDLSPTP
jgi:hypothetical protein